MEIRRRTRRAYPNGPRRPRAPNQRKSAIEIENVFSKITVVVQIYWKILPYTMSFFFIFIYVAIVRICIEWTQKNAKDYLRNENAPQRQILESYLRNMYFFAYNEWCIVYPTFLQ